MHYSSVKVNDEPATYGEGSSFSYVRDMFILRTHLLGNALPPRRLGDGIQTVRVRLARHAKEMSYLGRRGGDAERALIRDFYTERHRPYHQTVSDHSLEDWRAPVLGEFRDSTAATSMGPFAPPVYLLQDWLKWRTAAAPAAARSGSRPLPPTGMAVDLTGLTSSPWASRPHRTRR